ncbi:DUF4238 domain-containing protein [Vibrio campbellii]|uniref:DUF4238 domain-containing protein n=1 Tax=Vibrio campbellii TaxID=680 RepID=UPI000154377E|nr:hypothetical protein A1Q_3849 [Vibrio campbellii HY01]
MFDQKKKKQHYVWRRYLKSWLVDDKLACMRNKQHVFSTADLMNVGQKSYFYKVNSLSEQDIRFVRDMFLSDVDETVSSICERLFSLFRHVEQVEKLESDGSDSDIEKLKQHYANNLEEEIQSEIESQGDPCLTKLLLGDVSFFENDESAAHFLNYLCMQYLRTKKHHDALVSGVTGVNREQIIKCANLIRIVFSAKLAANLYVNRSNYKLVIARNISDTPFITSDQPVVNFLDTKTDLNQQTEEFGLYYPLSPELAVFLVEKDIFGSVLEMSLDKASVEEFNQITLSTSHEQVYASSETQLKSLLVELET